MLSIPTAHDQKKVIKKPMKTYSRVNFEKIPQMSKLSSAQVANIKDLSWLIPFKVNDYVVNELIDWDNWQDDPVFNYVFPNDNMLPKDIISELKDIVGSEQKPNMNDLLHLYMKLNPHPAEQLSNIPSVNDDVVPGVQHKYQDTALVFPTQGQTCHSYCNYCFRWPQFFNLPDMSFKTNYNGNYLPYLEEHKEISDVLITGGDPMIMRTTILEKYIEPLLSDKYAHIKNIRIGTKALTFWPDRFTEDKDASELLKLFEKVNRSGKNISVMSHFTHPKELETESVKKAISNILSTGSQIRSQAPLLKNVNDSADAWATMWNEQVRLGIVPYYMFIERNTGPYDYYRISLAEALKIYKEAQSKVTGLAKTARGPVMSSTRGKVQVIGTVTQNDVKYFLLKLIRAKNQELEDQIFMAEYSENAHWVDELNVLHPEIQFPA
jgi:KamA family protein